MYILGCPSISITHTGPQLPKSSDIQIIYTFFLLFLFLEHYIYLAPFNLQLHMTKPNALTQKNLQISNLLIFMSLMFVL